MTAARARKQNINTNSNSNNNEIQTNTSSEELCKSWLAGHGFRWDRLGQPHGGDCSRAMGSGGAREQGGQGSGGIRLIAIYAQATSAIRRTPSCLGPTAMRVAHTSAST